MFYVFFGIIFGLIMCMDLLECVLHCVRLIWVEFMNKFYVGSGMMFAPFDLNQRMAETMEKSDDDSGLL